MRKKYLHDTFGQGDKFWEGNWDRDWDKKYASPPTVHRKLIRQMEKYLTPDMIFLEGGCGDCQYLRYFADRGYRMVGVDFAKETVHKVNKLLPHLMVTVGDILNLPFPDNYFDAYYSGGVIEHFEEGVDKPLREAYRVLKPDGYLFVTVPNINPVRRISSRYRKTAYSIDLDNREAYYEEDKRKFILDIPPKGFHFHEYHFSPCETRKFLSENGFSVIEETSFSPMAGLWDIHFYMELVGRGKKKRSLLNKAFAAPIRYCSYMESHDSLLFRFLSDVNCMIVGNLRLTICRVRKE